MIPGFKERKTAVVNLDDPAATRILQSAKCATLTYGVEGGNGGFAGLQVDVKASGGEVSPFMALPVTWLALPITGMFNVYNVLGAVGAALAED